MLILFLSSTAFAQTSFFTVWPGHPDFSPLPPSNIPGVEVEYPITVNLRSLVLNSSTRQRYSLRLANGSTQVFELKAFDGMSGFIPLGNSDIQPDPNVPDSALSYSWYGMSGNETFYVAVRGGRISATLIGKTKNYSITKSRGTLVFRRFNPRLVPNDGRIMGHPSGTPRHIVESTSSPKFLDFIDVLVLHTPAALAALNGDEAQLDVIVEEAIGQSNQTISNSGITSFKMRNASNGVHMSTLINYNEAPTPPAACVSGPGFCRWVGHRIFARTNSTVQSLRNSRGADLVVMVVADQFDVTGVAYVQRPNCGVQAGLENTPGCSVGLGYNNFAVAVVSLPYITSFQVFAHETGHQLGMEHDFVDGASTATPSFPWSFGWYVNGVNETVMSIAGSDGLCSSCPRALHYSNPNIPFLNSSVPSGTNSAWNARTGAALAPGVSEFRNPVLNGLLFRTGFESLPIP